MTIEVQFESAEVAELLEKHAVKLMNSYYPAKGQRWVGSIVEPIDAVVVNIALQDAGEGSA